MAFRCGSEYKVLPSSNPRLLMNIRGISGSATLHSSEDDYINQAVHEQPRQFGEKSKLNWKLLLGLVSTVKALNSGNRVELCNDGLEGTMCIFVFWLGSLVVQKNSEFDHKSNYLQQFN